jgi:cardiolipin synthase
MAFVPLLAILIAYQMTGWALGVFFLAGITDMLDGLIARRFGQKTPLGTFLDPIADKLLLVTSFTMLTFSSGGLAVRIPLWLTITVIGRDLLLVSGVLTFILTIGWRTFLPSRLGKTTTAFQLLLVLVVLTSNFIGHPLPALNVFLGLTFALTAASGLHYMWQGMQLIAQESPKPEAK